MSLEEQAASGRRLPQVQAIVYEHNVKKNALKILVIADKVESWRLGTKARCVCVCCKKVACERGKQVAGVTATTSRARTRKPMNHIIEHT